MPTYRSLAALRPAALHLVRGVSTLVLAAAALQAQVPPRKYLIEVSAAPVYQSFDNATLLNSGIGGVARLGVWLPLRFSLEGEAGVTGANTDPVSFAGRDTVFHASVKTFSAALLYNFRLGRRNFLYLKAGVGTVSYGKRPAISIRGEPVRGRAGTLIGGVGFRVGISPTLFIRGEGEASGSTVTDNITSVSTNITNVGVSLGASLMLGSKPVADRDRDGVLDPSDRCKDTPAGALVDFRGCPTDSDRDRVPDGLDRCPNSPAGATVDKGGCPTDADKDGVPDGIDTCADTPAGSVVNSRGCPQDSDRDGIGDGFDRCPETPFGATVDQLGCPGDADSDGVPDGLDRCPDTASGAQVNASGCPPATPSRQPREAPPAAEPAPAQQKQPTRAALATDTLVLRGVTFASGSARLSPESFPTLDSLAQTLLANPTLRVEIAGHTDAVGSPEDNLHLSTLRAEAVRNYLVSKGVPFQWLTAKGYGATVPLTTDTSPAGRAANRRVEIRPLSSGP